MSIVLNTAVANQISDSGFTVGDYVIADHAEYDDFSDDTFVVKGFVKNLLGQTIVKVQDIAHLGKVTGHTSFYAYELSFEDGSSPEDYHV